MLSILISLVISLSCHVHKSIMPSDWSYLICHHIMMLQSNVTSKNSFTLEKVSLTDKDNLILKCYRIASKNILYIAGLLITGGVPVYDTAELYIPSTGASCTLPSLPDDRWHHTVTEGGLLCGGANTRVSCIQWSPDSGTWEEALTLDVRRSQHVSWTPSSGAGTYLMGGYDSKRTTTLINNDGSQEPGFPLKYDA